MNVPDPDVGLQNCILRVQFAKFHSFPAGSREVNAL